MDSTPSIETISIFNVPNMVHIGHELIDYYIANDLICLTPGILNYVVITDQNVAPLFLKRLVSSIQQQLQNEQKVLECIIAPGEQSKSRNMKATIEDFLLDSSCTRYTCLIALGGGVIGDLVGYVASNYMMGIPYIQIPTTLLAMVDSNIGGYTGVDTPRGKNLIGSIWQPKCIYIDISLLETLPKREFSNGMAEVIKIAAISSEQDFMKLETGRGYIEPFSTSNNDDYSAKHEKGYPNLLLDIVVSCVRFKANDVSQNKMESGFCDLINFGHTLGDTYEKILRPDWLYGECVSVGLLHEAELAVELGYCCQNVISRLENCLHLYDLPVDFSVVDKSKLSVASVMETLKLDYKNMGSQISTVLLTKIGETVDTKATIVSEDIITKVLLRHLGNEPVPTGPTIINKPRLPINITLVACEGQYVDHILCIANAINDKFALSQIKSKRNRVKCVSAKHKRNIRLYITNKAGSNSDCNKNYPEYELVLLPNSSNIQQDSEKALHLIDKIMYMSLRHIDPSLDRHTSFITPTLNRFDNIFPHAFCKWIEGADAVEFRVDLLHTPSDKTNDWISTAGSQLHYLRQLTDLPIIFTVRTIPQAGKFDPSLQSTYYKLLEWAHRWCCEYIDVELTSLSLEHSKSLFRFNQLYQSKLIASYHDPDHLQLWSGNMMKHRYAQASQLFREFKHVGIIKLVGFAETFQDNLELEEFRQQMDPDNNKPIIFVNMGSKGKFSRVMNRFLTPATHPDLPCPAAPGQLSITQLRRIRTELDIK